MANIVKPFNAHLLVLPLQSAARRILSQSPSNKAKFTCQCWKSTANNNRHVRRYTTYLLIRKNNNIMLKHHQVLNNINQERHIVLLRVIRAVSKLRYIFLGAAGTAGVGAKLTYDKWKDKWLAFQDQIPDIEWMKEYYPQSFFGSLQDSLSENSSKLKEMLEATKSLLFGIAGDVVETVQPPVLNASIFPTAKEEIEITDEEIDAEMSRQKNQEQKLRELLTRAQEELLEMQQKFQREIDRLEQDNRDLRKQIMLGKNKTQTSSRKMKKSLIDMYSDVLDLLSEYDSNYDIQDHLPRVVVIGDQSAGKTSVLEMIARARIFPRGSGQMMTRCPIMVTLTEGPNHIAYFKGDEQQCFDLTKESDLKLLRQEVEAKMTKCLKRGQTISSDVLSMYVKGPGLPRMVLVDLPGIISTETSEMASHTKEDIAKVSRHYMSNPNAIILCIQDGSIDAERSIVTDLASQMDPTGKRTIFVMTKVDLAEANNTDPSRIRKILSGKLFPMKAMGYFAVVTGTGNNSESIDLIKQYEEDFFRSSNLFKSGILKASQMTTQNLSFAVANCFWQMVRESIEQQFDAFKAKKFNLETEWKNNYPTVRELDRDELFDKARGEILDEVLSLSQTKPHEWEQLLSGNLWKSIQEYAFEKIYWPGAQTRNPTEFKTKVDILLKQWAERVLPVYAVQVGYETLLSQFSLAMEEGVEIGGKKDAHSKLFEPLKAQVQKDCAEGHSWQARAKESLRVIQLTALEDSNVPSKEQWDDAIKFMEDTITLENQKSEQILSSLIGPGWQERWLYWTSRSGEQHFHNEIKKELDKLLQASEVTHSSALEDDEVTAVKRNLQTNNIEASPNEILRVWRTLYRTYFLDRSLQGVQECRKAYFHRHLAKNELECNDLILFWRFQKMLQTTSNSLRQQIMNTEARRLENEVKEILDEISQDHERKKELIKGRQVDLAEELKRVRHIQECLEQFVEALKREKSF
ncbi:dynamin-like 120 kDa protein, mitochondrial isoform X2 [Hydractinia symbiolongicarpus]|uniref:dynamin-like 120 kDa protein, mitochondrial isoform X2 n=1 Tax=Hydractinia symbiolongicarpus TaxID=13093 RepID=UPI00254F9E2B|nr:dynamin-like 120 kDa protein, mitochondrial isoform X2 [Hydractinia symbiolongicarpus]